MSFLLVCGNAPWLGKNYFSTNGSRYAVVAKNYLRYGFLKTKFAPVQDYGVRFPENPNYYINHPILLYLLLSISFVIFGVHSWAARFVPIAASVGSLLLVYAVAKRWWGSLCATCAAFFFAFMPMTTIFGSLVNFEPPTAFFMLLAVYYYQRWFDMRTRRDLYLLGGCIFLANFCEALWFVFLVVRYRSLWC
jgi:4-amino-4-deoxy-L-arabinose transferase-like glycosyltransferase